MTKSYNTAAVLRRYSISLNIFMLFEIRIFINFGRIVLTINKVLCRKCTYYNKVLMDELSINQSIIKY